MKARLLTLISLLALLMVSTAVLADGRPTGIRIGRAVFGGNNNVEIDVTVPGTNSLYSHPNFSSYSTTVWLGEELGTTVGGFTVWQYASPASQYGANIPLPYAIDWGDGNRTENVSLFGTPGGPFRGTFQHTYTPGQYTITVGDAICCGYQTVTTGNSISGTLRYVRYWGSATTIWTTFGAYKSPILLAVTANTTVSTGTGIPTLNIYGLLAMAFVLVGTGVLLYRKPQRTVA